MRQVIIVVISVLILIGSFVASGALSKRPEKKKKTEKAAPVKLVQTKVVENKEIQAQVSVYGRLVPFEKTEIFAELGGMMTESAKPMKEGTRFAKGELLLKIDHREQELNLKAQRAQLLTSITQMMPDIKIDYQESLEQWNAYRADFSLEDKVKALPKPQSDREKDFITLRNIYNQFYNIKSLEERLTKYQIYAPFSGELTEVAVNTGSMIRAGQKIATLMNTGVYELQASVPIEDLKYIKIGDQVNLKSEDVEGNWKGYIARISSSIETKTQTVKLYIKVMGSQLRENMFLSGAIKANRIANAIELPRKLLVKDNELFTVKGDSVLALSEVQILKFSEKTVLIRGLENGTVLLNERFPGAFDGMKVKVSSPK